MHQALPIARRSLHHDVASLMRDMIIAGELAPGVRIAEAELCARFGVSRTPLREALKVLAAEGLIVLQPNRGAAVARTTPEEIDELFPIMGALEALAGELACGRLSGRDLADLEAVHADMVDAHRRGEWVACSKLNRAIHEKLFASAGNAALTQLYQTLMVRIHAVRFVARRSAARWRQAVEDHERLMAGLRARDGATVASVLREHLRHKAEMVREALETPAPADV
jgi:DNA-binding GntR family transcriptional regulator